MATQTPVALADGQLSTTQTAIYTVPANTIVLPTLLTLQQTNAALQTMVFYLNKSGASREYLRMENIAQKRHIEVRLSGEVLEAGDVIEALTTTASAVNFWLNGLNIT